MRCAVWPPAIAAVLFGALASSSCALAGETDAPLTTAQPGASQAPPDVGGASATTAGKIQDFLSSDDDGAALDLGPPTPDRKIHGTVDAWVGNHGTRGVAVQAVMPLGKHGVLGLAFSTGHGPGAYGPGYYGAGYYGPGDFDSNGYGMRLVRRHSPLEMSGPAAQTRLEAGCEPPRDAAGPDAAPPPECSAH
jgi:hypothetical protein